MQYTKIPQIVDSLINRLSAKATTDGYTSIANKFATLKPVTWCNLPYQLNKVMDIVVLYQAELQDGGLQDLIDDIGIIIWYRYFKKVSLLNESVELIETL